jgi:hypothetical protein
MTRWSIAAVVLALLAGCDHAGSRPAESTDKSRLVYKLEPMTLPKDLPREACFVGLHSYDVMLLGVRLPKEYSCATLADDLFPGVEQLPWSRGAYQSSDQVDECELERGGGRLQVMRSDFDREGPRFGWAYEHSQRACERLEKDGWNVLFQEK